MRGVSLVAFAICLLAGPAGASAAKFGGFSQDGQHYLDGDAKVCAAVDAIADGTAIGTPQCQRVADKKELAAHAFKKPRAGRETPDGKVKLSIASQGKKIEIKGAGGDKESVLVSWEAGEDVDSIADVYVSSDGSLVALDYTSSGLRGKLPATVAFNIRKPIDALLGAAPAPDKGTPPKPDKPGAAYDRAMKHGGAWEQALVPCDIARVTLKLKKTRTYTLRIETRCQGDKWVSSFDGKWVAEGDDELGLQLENEDGTVETMPCKLSVSDEAGREKEDALTCTQEDVTFSMKPVKR
jgi:hypothetical protein